MRNLYIFLFVLYYGQAFSQTSSLKDLMSSMDTLRKKQPIEKLYIHFDKSNYAIGDTIWFKAYLFEGPYLTESTLSGSYYMELKNHSTQVSRRFRIPVKFGVGWGNITLDSLVFPEGEYTLYAYSNWMRNQGADEVFRKSFFLTNPSQSHWLFHADARALNSADINKENLPLELRKRLSPIFVNGTIDLQFLPEGGHLVSGIGSRLGFKAINENGRGVPVEGNILDSKKQVVQNFKSVHKGMGYVDFQPVQGEVYTAQIALDDGSIQTYPIPAVASLGTVLRVLNDPGRDSIEIKIDASEALQQANDTYFFVGQARGVVCYARQVALRDNPILKIPKNIFPTGIIRFSLLNKELGSLNERLTFVNHGDGLKLELHANATTSSTRDSVSLDIIAKDTDGNPIQGTFSIAVTDDNQSLGDDLNYSDINNHLLFTSELKGWIEDPNYYTQNQTEAKQALDILLLTQGWTSYDWKDVHSPAEPAYSPEPEFVVTGRATGTFRGIPNTKVMLYGSKPFVMADTVTDQKGYFTFKNLPLSDTASYLVQAFNRNGRSFIVNVEIDEWEPPTFPPPALRPLPWFVSSDSSAVRTLRTIVRNRESTLIQGDGRLLREVVITGKKIISNSRNLNGPGEADQTLSEADFTKDTKTTLLDILFKKIDGFGVMGRPRGGVDYKIKNKKLKVIIDGVDIEQMYAFWQPISEEVAAEEGINERFRFMNDNFANFMAEDIVGIEVMYNSQYNGNYNRKYLSTDEQMGVSHTRSGSMDYAYLEITTVGGRGPFIKNTPGTASYKPLSFSLPKQFYSPKYSISRDSPIPDLRSTIYWNPNVITNEEGKATVYFYTADSAGTYSVSVQGSDMLGKAGSIEKTQFIKISK